MQQFPYLLAGIIFFILIILASAIRILRDYERGVIFRLGRLIGNGGVKGPGLILLIPFIDRMVKVSLRTVVLDAPPQDVITQDNVCSGLFPGDGTAESSGTGREFSRCHFADLTNYVAECAGTIRTGRPVVTTG